MDGMKKQISELKKLGLFALQKTQEAAPEKPQNDLNFVPQH